MVFSSSKRNSWSDTELSRTPILCSPRFEISLHNTCTSQRATTTIRPCQWSRKDGWGPTLFSTLTQIISILLARNRTTLGSARVAQQQELDNLRKSVPI